MRTRCAHASDLENLRIVLFSTWEFPISRELNACQLDRMWYLIHARLAARNTSSPRRSSCIWPGIGPDSRPILAGSRPAACPPRTRTRTPPVDPARSRLASDPSGTAGTTGTWCNNPDPPGRSSCLIAVPPVHEDERGAEGQREGERQRMRKDRGRGCGRRWGGCTRHELASPGGWLLHGLNSSLRRSKRANAPGDRYPRVLQELGRLVGEDDGACGRLVCTYAHAKVHTQLALNARARDCHLWIREGKLISHLLTDYFYIEK